MAESLPIPSIGDVNVPGSLKLTGGAGGAATGGNIGGSNISFGAVTVNGKDQQTMLILGAVALAFLWITNK